MGTILLNLALKLLTGKAMESLIAIGINKLLNHQEDGIGKELSKTMINGIAKSKLNPTTTETFKEALELLDK